MKQIHILIKVLFCFLCFVTYNSSAQRNVIADTLTNDATGELKFITDSTVRVIISDSGDVIMNGSLVFPDTMSSLSIDSIKCKIIHVGDSSITIGGGNFPGTTTSSQWWNNTISSSTTGGGLKVISQSLNGGSYGTFELQSGNGKIAMGNTGSNYGNLFVGIGKLNPQANLHIHSDIVPFSGSNPVTLLFTNLQNNTSGFRIGVDGASGESFKSIKCTLKLNS